jgi:putative chitinase
LSLLVKALGSSIIYSFSEIPPALLKKLQIALHIPADGIYGPVTANALVALKRDRKIPGGNNLTQTDIDTFLAEPQQRVTINQLRSLFGRTPTPQQINDANACLTRFDITGDQIAHFFAQLHVESGGLRWMMEIASGWDYDISRNPQKAKNLGNLKKGDGPKYKGAGPLQITGGANIKALGDYLKDPLCYKLGSHYVAETYPFTSAGFWWMQNHMKEKIAQGATASQVSRQVNRGNWHSEHAANHESERIAAYKIAKSLWP